MRLLKLAVRSQRWDLAAHTIVVAMAQQLSNGEKPNARKREEKKKHIKA